MSIGVRFLLVFGLCYLIGVQCKSLALSKKSSTFNLRATTNDTDHNHEHDLPEPSFFVDQIFYRFSNETSNYSLIDVEALEEIMMYFSIEIHDDHDHEHEHEHEHDYETIYRKKLVDDIPETNYSFCYSSEELMEIFHIHDTVITKSQFAEMSASILWMAMTEECHEHHHHHHDEGTPAKEKYLFGALTIFVIWLLSFIAVFTIGKLHNGKQNVIMALRALAVGTLLSDALLHLIPSAFGLHSHSHGDDDHDDHDDEADTRSELDPVWKMTASVGTIFVLWLFESFMHHHHHHDHDFEDECKEEQHCDEHHCENGQISLEEKQKPANTDPETLKTESGTPSNVTVKTNNIKKEIKNVHANGWIAFAGDALHKIADGLAIGAAFSESLSLGFSTGLAILFHEIPHELGDFAVLLGAGFKFYTILILNTITSLIGLVAFFIISAVSSNETVREWIFAVTVGVFLYIALVNMVPRLKQFFEENKQKNVKLLVVVILSFVVGWVVMLLLAVFEEQIQFKI